jgi:hypothetical protein
MTPMDADGEKINRFPFFHLRKSASSADDSPV